MQSAHRLMLVNVSVTFHEDILNSFQIIGRMALYSVLGIANVQRSIIQKYISQEFGSCDLHIVIMLINISMTFHEDILNGFQVTELQSGRHCILFLV